MNNKTDIVVKNQYISSPFYVNLTCTDNIESHMKALTGWDTCYNQISEGAFEGEVFEFACQDTQIFRSQCNQSLSKQGSAAGDTLPIKHAYSLTKSTLFLRRKRYRKRLYIDYRWVLFTDH